MYEMLDYACYAWRLGLPCPVMLYSEMSWCFVALLVQAAVAGALADFDHVVAVLGAGQYGADCLFWRDAVGPRGPGGEVDTGQRRGDHCWGTDGCAGCGRETRDTADVAGVGLAALALTQGSFESTDSILQCLVLGLDRLQLVACAVGIDSVLQRVGSGNGGESVLWKRMWARGAAQSGMS